MKSLVGRARAHNKMNKQNVRQIPKMLPSYVRTYFKVKILKRKRFVPEHIILYITEACNLNCRHCFYAKENVKFKSKELTLQEHRKIALSIGKGVQSLSFTGGEPFLRKDLTEVVNVWIDAVRPSIIRFMSHGMFTEQIVEIVRGFAQKFNGRITVQISLDGLPELHETIRRQPGLFHFVEKTIQKLKCLSPYFPNLEVVVLTCVTNYNYRQLKLINTLVEKALEVKHSFEFVRGSSFIESQPELLNDYNPQDKDCYIPPKGEWLNILNNIEDIHVSGNYASLFSRATQLATFELETRTLQEKRRLLPCLAPYIEAVIMSNGDVRLCEMSHPVGNLRQWNHDFLRLWSSHEAEEKRKELSYCYCTHGCHLSRTVLYNPYTIMKKMWQLGLKTRKLR